MLAVTLFIAFWVILGVALVFVAIRGGLGGARETLQTQSRGGRGAMNFTFVIIYVLFGLAVPLAILIGNNKNTSKQVSGISLNASQKRGRELFGQTCAVCHTLGSASAVGKVGPNLDQLQPPASLVLHTIQYGCLQSPPPGDQAQCLGQGTMPALLLQGRDATDVANYVARVAGK